MLNITQLNSLLLARPFDESGTLAAVPAAAGPSHPARLNAVPIVTWRVTRLCNRLCRNRFSDARPRAQGLELGTREGKALIRDLAAFGVPRLVFAGGERLLRPGMPQLVAYACGRGVEPRLGSSGALLTPAKVADLKRAGLDSAMDSEISKEIAEQVGAMEEDVLLGKEAA